MARITLTVIHGGGDQLRMVQRLTVSLRNHLWPLAERRHSRDIDTFGLKLFVSGELHTFRGDGLELARVWKKKRSATGELVMQEELWKKGTRGIKRFLRGHVLLAITELCARIERAGLHIDTKAMLDDLRAALAAFERAPPARLPGDAERVSRPARSASRGSPRTRSR